MKGLQLQDKILKKEATLISAFLSLACSTAIVAEEKVIQEEKMSFDKCLAVIKTSETKLSISPEILDISNQKRIAVFVLSDGNLKIICDGEKGVVTVTTEIS